MSDLEATTQVLLEDAQAGNRDALNELMRRYLPRVHAVVRIRLGDFLRQKVESWDVVQEVMQEAFSGVSAFEYRTEGAFLKYLNKMWGVKQRP